MIHIEELVNMLYKMGTFFFFYKTEKEARKLIETKQLMFQYCE